MSNNPTSYPILNQTGPIYISDIRLVDNNTVHINGTEIISGEKTFNNKIKTTSLENTGSIITNIIQTNSITTSNGKKYLRLLNLSNYNTTSNTYITQIINNISSTYVEIILTTLIQTSITNTFLSIVNNKFIFNEIGEYYININIIYSIDSTIINNFNINYSLNNSKSIIDQDIALLNFKYQNIITQIYNVNSINSQNLLLYISASDIITLTIYKINIDIIKLN